MRSGCCQCDRLPEVASRLLRQPHLWQVLAEITMSKSPFLSLLTFFSQVKEVWHGK